MGYHLRGNGLHLLMDAVGGGSHLRIGVRDILALDKLGDEAAVGGDNELTYIGKLRTCLGDDDLLAVEVLHLDALEDLMGMAIEHDIDATGVVHKTVGTESHRLRCLAYMGEQHHIVGSLATGCIHSLLDQLVEGLRLQVIEQDAVGIVEGIALEDHRLRRTGTDIGHLLIAILMDDVGCEHRMLLASLIEIGTYDRRSYLFEQCSHAGHTVVELMVAKGESVVIHQSQDVGDVLTLGDGSRGVALQEVATADGCCIGRIRLVDGIAQSCHLRIAVDAAMGVVLIEDYDTLLCIHSKTAHHKSHQA